MMEQSAICKNVGNLLLMTPETTHKKQEGSKDGATLVGTPTTTQTRKERV
uniref:Uncharacterized protein n=1 Tax=Meloidogyne enterolobii TaxID=390850 RepID=A0A6V7TQG6_MELEN|nr:unnamed protein product [Meloidogyne enterolobii]